MASTTPTGSISGHNRSASRSRNPPSRPTTPLRPISRSSLRDSASARRRRFHGDNVDDDGQDDSLPLEELEPAFAELSDGMADLEANLMHMQLLHESLARFSENFASFLYGLNMNAFCVDFPEAPISESFKLAKQQEALNQSAIPTLGRHVGDSADTEATFLTTDTSFVENPPTSSKASSKYSTPAPASRIGRGASSIARGRGASSTTSNSRGGIPRGRASGLARASTRGRGNAR